MSTDESKVIETPTYSGTVLRALQVLLAGGAPDSLVFAGNISNISASNQILLADDTPDTPRLLAQRGYLYSHRFALLPSRETTRWLVPRNPDSQIVNGLQMYPSFSIRATVYKSFASRMAAMGWPGWAGNSLWVASKQRFPIEKLIEDITGEARPQFSLSLGTPVANRKLTVQVMRPNGEILGYFKLPLTGQADAKIRDEAAVLERLKTKPSMRAHVPGVLYASNWGAGYLLFQSPIAGEPGPTRFTALHQEALRAMHSIHSSVKPGEWLVREAGEKIHATSKKLGPKWEDLAREGLQAAELELRERNVQCGLGHGDFTPWNSRVHEGTLCLVDWEMASWDAPLLWDTFHFLVQTQSLLRQGDGPEGLPDLTNEKRALYVLYLVCSAAQLAEDAPQTSDITFREAQLRGQLRSLSTNRTRSESLVTRHGSVSL
jgi:hypothetical protein